MSVIDTSTLKYIQDISNHPLLTYAREKELAKIIRSFKSGKQRTRAIEEIVKHNLKLVVKEAFRYHKKTRIEIDDFIGAGNEGLMRAAERFNPKRFKTRFSTYATYWIREAMQDLVYRSSSIVTIPVHISNGIARHKRILNDENGKDISDKRLMKEIGVNEKGLGRIVGAKKISVLSMSHTLSNGSYGKNSDVTVGDIIEDEASISPSETSSNNNDYEILYGELEKLDEKTLNIVMSQCMDDEKTQLSKLGKQYNLTGERIRQIKSKALKKLRKKLSKHLAVKGKRLKD